MTAKERAEEYFMALDNSDRSARFHSDFLIAHIESHAAEAVEAERDAIAQMADRDKGCGDCDGPEELADDIRAKGDNHPPQHCVDCSHKDYCGCWCPGCLAWVRELKYAGIEIPRYPKRDT